jgi:hypothetical protein
MGELVLDESIPDAQLRNEILWRIPDDEMATLVDGCRQLRTGDDGSHLGLTAHWYAYTREYSPALLEKTAFRFAEQSALGRAVAHLRLVNREHRRKLGQDAPIDFLPPRWRRHVIGRDAGGQAEISRPHYELAVLTTLNEQLKSGDVTVARSRRWTDFEEYLIPRTAWAAEREQHYAVLGLPIDSDAYLAQLEQRLHTVTANVDGRVPQNPALTIDRDKAEFHLARLKASPEQDDANRLKDQTSPQHPLQAPLSSGLVGGARCQIAEHGLPDLARQAALEDPQRIALGLAGCTEASDVGLGLWIDAEAGERHVVQHGIQAPVAEPIEPMMDRVPMHLGGRGWDGRRARVAGEGIRGSEAAGIADFDHELGGPDRAKALERRQLCGELLQPAGDRLLEGRAVRRHRPLFAGFGAQQAESQVGQPLARPSQPRGGPQPRLHFAAGGQALVQLGRQFA